VIVACAGENDIGNGVSLDHSLMALRQFLDAICSNEKKAPSPKQHHLIFLGPKFEPWLEDDPASKKAYSKMSRAFARCCKQHDHADQIHFLDCLTMFCGDTATIPGAALVGRAKADDKYFAADGVHLSSHGYSIWQQVVQERIHEIVS
jgi:lysophospholipase L1-like esterase